MFKVLNAYAGWSNVNYVLNEVRNPVRTLKIAGPLGLGICAVLYLLANVSYFSYVVFSFPFYCHGYLFSEHGYIPFQRCDDCGD